MSNVEELSLISVAYAEENSSAVGESCLSSLLSLVVSLAECGSDTENFTGRTHLRSEDRIDLLEHIERENSFLYAIVVDLAVLELRNG